MSVPFVDMNPIHEPLLEEFVSSLRDIVTRSAFANGPEVKEFEDSFAAWVGTKYCIGISSGLDAEVIALRAMGVQPGDSIIAPAMTFIATTEAISHVGAVPILVDVDDSGLIDLDQVEKELKKGARYILPVHLFGQLVDPDKLKKLEKTYSAKILEDACQAHGAKYRGFSAGTIGQAAAFSFYPGKNLGALGDGGAICTNDPEVNRIARALKEHGQIQKYHHIYEGYTARLDNLQAAFLSSKLRHLDKWTEQRISAANYYIQNLKDLKNGRLQSMDVSGRHVYHLFAMLTDRREQLSEEFKKKNIGYGFHYPIPIHQMPCYEGRKWTQGRFPNSEKYATQSISLPLYPGITKESQNLVIESIRKVCG